MFDKVWKGGATQAGKVIRIFANKKAMQLVLIKFVFMKGVESYVMHKGTSK